MFKLSTGVHNITAVVVVIVTLAVLCLVYPLHQQTFNVGHVTEVTNCKAEHYIKNIIDKIE